MAHREEILKQSLYTFRAVLKDANFGELFVGNYKPESIDNLFLSIQTFNSQSFTEKTSPDFYDYIIVDEFHHAAAPTYQKLLSYYQPRILLGLTATPERMDGKSILPYFHNRIAAEIRLPEAIDRKLLCPFQYFGVTDTVDLDALKWSAGGYQKSELEHIYTFSGAVADRRADHVVTALLKYVTDIDEVKGLGFCVTVDHAEFMCRYFNDHNIPSMCLTGQSSDEERAAAKRRLVSGEVRFIFVVDIYNEGVDIPEVNTVLFLRPTESLTIFLQQLGRGLRLSEDKECLTVLDFIDEPVELGFDCPLDLHCTYTRDQLLVALDFMKPSTVREGVKWLPEKNIDVFFVTLNKADKDYSPTTMYNDYSINESLFHWQSQSTTAENSPTGQRYIHHKERGSKVLLFVREFKSDRVTGGAEAYTYLGTANYVKHTGSRPMNITW